MELIIKKLKFKEKSAIAINSPKEMESKFMEFGFKTQFNSETQNKNIIAFINNQKEAIHFFENKLNIIEYDSVLWLAYPKKKFKNKNRC